MSLNLYETTTMLEALKQTPPIFTFVKDTFFKQAKFMKTEKAIIDIVKGGVKASVFVAPRVNGVLETRKGYKTFEITTPRLAPKRVLTGEDLEKRQPGDNIYTTRSPQEVAAQILMNDLIEEELEIVLATEWFCTQILQGKSLVIDEYDESGNKAGIFEVDFGFTNFVKTATADKWTNDKSTPIEQIEQAIDDYLIGKTSATPTVVMLDPNAGKAFSKNKEVKEILDYRARAGRLQESQYKGRGVTSYGTFTKYNVEIISYSNIIGMGDATPSQVLDAGTALILPNDPGEINYGAITQKENGRWVKYMEKFVPKYVIDNEKEVDSLRLASRPLPVLKDIDSVINLQGVC